MSTPLLPNGSEKDSSAYGSINATDSQSDHDDNGHEQVGPAASNQKKRPVPSFSRVARKIVTASRLLPNKTVRESDISVMDFDLGVTVQSSGSSRRKESSALRSVETSGGGDKIDTATAANSIGAANSKRKASMFQQISKIFGGTTLEETESMDDSVKNHVSISASTTTSPTSSTDTAFTSATSGTASPVSKYNQSHKELDNAQDFYSKYSEENPIVMKRKSSVRTKLHFKRAVKQITRQNQKKSKFMTMHGKLAKRVRIGASAQYIQDFYFYLLEMSWKQLVCVILLMYLAIALVFAGLYWTYPEGLDPNPTSFLQVYYHSLLVLAAIESPFKTETDSDEYNDMIWVVFLLEGFLSVIAGALFIGLIVDRLSRPEPRVIFSKNILLSMFNRKPRLMFRIANERNNNLIDLEVELYCIRQVVTEEGHRYGQLTKLQLDNGKRPFMFLSLTLFHTIDESSPIYQWDAKRFHDEDTTFWVKVTGEDSTFEKTIHALHAYSSSDVAWNAKFADVVSQNPDTGVFALDFRRFHDILL